LLIPLGSRVRSILSLPFSRARRLISYGHVEARSIYNVTFLASTTGNVISALRHNVSLVMPGPLRIVDVRDVACVPLNIDIHAVGIRQFGWV
jgi:hypothetical protein